MADMANFIQSLKSFRNAELPLEELLLKIDRMILSDPTSAEELLETLIEENTKNPLTQQAYDAIKQNIQKRTKEVHANEQEQTPPPVAGKTSESDNIDEDSTKIAPAFTLDKGSIDQDAIKAISSPPRKQTHDVIGQHIRKQREKIPAQKNEPPLLPITGKAHESDKFDRDLTKHDSAFTSDNDIPDQDSATVEGTVLDELIGVSHHANDKRIKGTGDILNGRFELKECLGSGGMSTVYKALDRRKQEANDRHPYVSVKVLNQDFRAHPDSLIALQREAKKSQTLAHPNIVRVYDFDRDGDTIYMTMEYLSGESLGVRINKPGFKGIPAKEAFPIISAMGKALSFAHENGIVHSDFKPANVIMTDRGEVKVIDFGIARAFSRAEDPSSMEMTRFDPGSLGALTPSYASPEMLEHQEPDPRDDIYALACTTYEMLTGQHPFKRMQANIARDAGFKVEGLENLNRKQRKVLQEALQFDRKKRTPTVTQFLQQFLPPETKPRRFPIVGSVLGLLVLGGIALGYHLFLQNGQILTLGEDAKQHNLQIPKPTGTHPRVDQDQIPYSQDNTTRMDASTSPDSPNDPVRPDIAQPAPPAPALATLESITPLLKRLPCAAIQASVEEGKVTLSGYARQADITRLERDLQSSAGVTLLNTNIRGLDNAANYCEVTELFSPYWIANRQQRLGTSIQTSKPGARFSAGEYLVLDIKSPFYKAYITIDYYSLDGGVVHMLPSPRSPNNLAPAKYSATLGDLGEWRVAEPYGTEMIVLLATSEPLFDRPRKEFETQAEYLPELRQRLARLQARLGSDRISADFLLISTSP
jgi:serine/threonine protein kinase